MDRDGFWELVEAARAEVDDTVADPDGVADALTKALGELAPAEIAGFGVELERLQAESYRWDLWGAAYLINEGVSDDGFDYFRGWLLAQGQEVWEAALADPDSLADVVDEDLGDGFEGFNGEGMLSVAQHAFEAAGGSSVDYWEAVEEAGFDAPDVPAGENFDFDDDAEMESRYPLLSAIQDS
ncbi:DUF4240 domain-containing protein [Kribbella sp. CA-293567]|uniref:DUF4240 domain-containing protein n=1 Tax=Kribbella sp. CA-293567 TaxID=3002436 RepID=UPI0022DE931C|nr:DUF4240 domain-containing protein [Kribbella sp. CA-293567]WBQ05233.1 DUF4240 domain-containing protein [Kribbella sp. CA-293567]